MRVTLENIDENCVVFEFSGVYGIQEACIEGSAIITCSNKNYIIKPRDGEMLVIHEDG